MKSLTGWIYRLLRCPARAELKLRGTLSTLAGAQGIEVDQTLPLLQQLIDALRPLYRGDPSCEQRYRLMVELLESDQEMAQRFRQRLLGFMASRRLVTFFTDSGILPESGFFSEWWRILGQRILPELADERRFKDCLQLIYRKADDWVWLENLPTPLVERFWAVVVPEDQDAALVPSAVRAQLFDAIQLLSHRISGLGLDGELMRATPDFDEHTPRFIALSAEAAHFVHTHRAELAADTEAGPQPDDGAQLLVIIAQCGETLSRIRKRAQSHGTSLHLTYQLTRGKQSLNRLEQLVQLLRSAQTQAAEARVTQLKFVRQALIAENRRNSMGHYLSQLSGLLAMRVTTNAARSGEHYICESPEEYRHMWRSAAGAGLLIGGMALLKILAGSLHPPLALQALLYSLIYGIGFVLIYLLGMTVATKQPAMTAQTLARLLSDLRPNRPADVERVVDVMAAVSRSQVAAILGNILVALPIALLLSGLWSHFYGQPPISAEKSLHLLADLDPLGWALPHAAVAGVFLFVSGLITGYFDNHAAYNEIGARVARIHRLSQVIGPQRAARIGQYVQAHLGGIMGNFTFGCMLGSTGVIGTILGLPLDIRHIAFSSANLGYASSGLAFELPLHLLLWSILGVLLIGLTNLFVSFSLALHTALKARHIAPSEWGSLLRALIRRIWYLPRSFFLP